MTTTYSINLTDGDDLTLKPDANEPGMVSDRALPRAEAREVVAALIAAGREASSAPDHDDRSREWIYVR